MCPTTQLYPAQGWRHPQGIRVLLGKLYQGTSHRLSVASDTYWLSIANKVDKLDDQDGLPYFLMRKKQKLRAYNDLHCKAAEGRNKKVNCSMYITIIITFLYTESRNRLYFGKGRDKSEQLHFHMVSLLQLQQSSNRDEFIY